MPMPNVSHNCTEPAHFRGGGAGYKRPLTKGGYNIGNLLSREKVKIKDCLQKITPKEEKPDSTNTNETE